MLFFYKNVEYYKCRRISIMEKVLLLDNENHPINFCSWKRAFILLMKGKAEYIDTINKIEMMINNNTLSIPSVIRLTYKINIQNKELAYCRENIFVRDNYTCQYCGKKFPVSELTLDHVYPKSRLGPDIWENIVTCCKKCNQYKADRTPKEAKMKLYRRPYRPNDVLRFELQKYSLYQINLWEPFFHDDEKAS